MSQTEKIEFEAALWVTRLERELTAAEQDQFLEWLGANPQHGEALRQQSAGWERLNLLADWRPVHGARPNRDLLAPPPAHRLTHLKRRIAWFVPISLAAAAAVALGAFISRREMLPEAASIRIAPGHIALIERRTLDDGSTIELNRGAELVVKYTKGERRIWLERGEAHFQVAKDPKRPFTVSSGGVTTRALGTAFSVQRKTHAVEIVVTEGKIDVRTAETANAVHPALVATLVEAGQRCIVSLAPSSTPPAVTALTREETTQLLAWQSTLLDFTEARLSAIVAEFNRRNAPFHLTLADPALAEIVLSASLRSDNVEGFLRLLEGAFGIQAERSGNVVTLRRSPRE